MKVQILRESLEMNLGDTPLKNLPAFPPITQWTECDASNFVDEGSNPSRRLIISKSVGSPEKLT